VNALDHPSPSLPHSDEAERSVIGSVLLDNNAIHKVQEVLGHEAFYSARHRRIFQALERLAEHGAPLDLVTLRAELDKMGELERSGGAVYLAELLDGASRAANVEYYARIVKEKAVLRQLIDTAQWIHANAGSADASTESILDEAEKKIFEVSQGRLRSGFVHIREAADETLKVLEDRTEHQELVTGVPTGYLELDEMTAGLQDTDLVILAARPSMGKTAFALNVVTHAALRQGLSVGVFSLEMSHQQLFQRMLCSEARVDAHRLRTGRISHDDWQRIIHAYRELSQTRVYIDDTPGVSILEVRAKARRLQLERKLDLLVIDYLQLMRGSGRYESRQQEISDISRSLKGLAKELGVPVVALSQLSRATEQRSGDHRPQLSDLRESGAIEQDADVVMFLFREEVYEKDDPDLKGKAEVIIGKQRNGPIGTVPLVFIREFTRFENPEWRDL
jgi:replicative DNA helicase